MDEVRVPISSPSLAIICGMLLASLGSAANGNTSDTPEALLASAKALYEERDYDESLKCVLAAESLQTEASPELLAMKIRAYTGVEDFASARQALAAFQSTPSNQFLAREMAAYEAPLDRKLAEHAEIMQQRINARAGSLEDAYRAYQSRFTHPALSDEETVSFLVTAAEGGYTPAQILLGDEHLDGRFGYFPRDSALAKQWYERAAEQGDVVGMVRLAEWYATYGSSRRAMRRYLKFAKASNPRKEAMTALCEFHTGVHDHAYGEAMKWCQAATSRGSAEAAMVMGELAASMPNRIGDRNDEKLDLDREDAVEFYTTAHKLGAKQAYQKLGLEFWWDRNGKRDAERAINYWEIGAADGCTFCMIELELRDDRHFYPIDFIRIE